MYKLFLRPGRLLPLQTRAGLPQVQPGHGPGPRALEARTRPHLRPVRLLAHRRHYDCRARQGPRHEQGTTITVAIACNTFRSG